MEIKRKKKKNNKTKLITFATALLVLVVLLVVLLIKINKNDSKDNLNEEPSTTENVTEPTTEEPTTEEPTTEEPTTEWEAPVLDVMVKSTDTTLDLSGKAVTDFDGFISQIEKFPALTYIDMCDCGLSNEQMEMLISKFPNIKFVWKVTLGLWTIRTDCVAFSTLKDGTIIYRLTNEDVKVLKYCTDMVALDLGHNKVTDLSFLQYMPELRILILVDNWMGENSEHYLNDLSMLKYCKKLMYLEFFVGDVTDISVLGELKEMVDLNISYNPISDVTPLLDYPKLERLYLEHTNMTEADYNLLKEKYPNSFIVYYGEGSVDQGWRSHDRYFAMIDMFHNNYVHDLFKYKG